MKIKTLAIFCLAFSMMSFALADTELEQQVLADTTPVQTPQNNTEAETKPQKTEPVAEKPKEETPAASTPTKETPEAKTETKPTETTPEKPAPVTDNTEPKTTGNATEPAAPVDEKPVVVNPTDKTAKKEEENSQNIIKIVLGSVGILTFVLFMGCVYSYRYQLLKYKVAPFTPPSFCPNFLFPRPEVGSGSHGQAYGEIEVGDYKAPNPGYLQF